MNAQVKDGQALIDEARALMAEYSCRLTKTKPGPLVMTGPVCYLVQGALHRFSYLSKFMAILEVLCFPHLSC